jgi:undecaprenyl-phosphate 4-deoxy-4-formamido-L-arabinose transferase
MQSVSVVIPVYNSADILPELLNRLAPVLLGLHVPYEVVFVNDGSRDESWTVVTCAARGHEWVRGINLMKNYGQHNALLCGIREARHEIIVTMDDDLQHPPEEIPKLLRALEEGADVVYGPPLEEQHGLWRDLASAISKIALRSAMGIDIARDVSAFRAFRASLRRAFADYRGSFISVDVLLTWGTSRFKSVPVRHDPRLLGESQYTFRHLATHAFNMITGFSTAPLQLASLVGFSFTLVGFLFLAYVVGRYLVQGGAPPGFPFLASQIAIFAGAQLFALGILGEYLARVHFRTLDKPSYVVRAAVSGAKETSAEAETRHP